MGRKLIITEKPSVARDFARVLGVGSKRDGYIESSEYVITWCVGHLVEMLYPEAYDIKYKKWKTEDLPFLPAEYKYGVIANVAKQYETVHSFLMSPDIDVVYWAGDSGKEGQTIEENIRNFGGVREGMTELRVWIDSQTDDEIRRGIAEARPMSAYANLGRSGIMRSIEDYALGINFSRVLSVKYGKLINDAAATKSYTAIAVGRVMTCVLGMVVRREREIREFKETPFFRVIGRFSPDKLPGEWKVNPKSPYFNSPALYKENGFKKEEDALALISGLTGTDPSELFRMKEEQVRRAAQEAAKEGIPEGKAPVCRPEYPGAGTAVVESVEKSVSKKKPPLLFNLAELQAECAKRFKISPDETLQVAQDLYERKMTTYPRTDARVLTKAVAGEITKNLVPLKSYAPTAQFVETILNGKLFEGLAKTQYTDDSKVTDHYAIIPTGQTDALSGLNDIQKKVYDLIVRRFLSIFFKPAEYSTVKIVFNIQDELFYLSSKILTFKGYLEVAGMPGRDKADKGSKKDKDDASAEGDDSDSENGGDDDDTELNREKLAELVKTIKKGDTVTVDSFTVREGKTSPPKRYTSGTMVLAMENAGNLIEDAELREQIKSTGIGTSATRAEIIKKLITIGYLHLNKKTQVLTPERLGEMIYEVVFMSVPTLLNPDMTAEWEKGLDGITRGAVDVSDYRTKLEDYIRNETVAMIGSDLTERIAGEIQNITGQDTTALTAWRPIGAQCPVCGGELTTTPFGYGCANYRNEEKPCRFSIGKIKGVLLDPEEVRTLVSTGISPVVSGFYSKNGKRFSAQIALDRDAEGRYTGIHFVFEDRNRGDRQTDGAAGADGQTARAAGTDGQEAQTAGMNGTSAQPGLDRTQLPGPHPIEGAACPVCGAATEFADGRYLCTGYRNGDCRFAIGPVMGVLITEEQFRALVNEGSTPVIAGFKAADGTEFNAALAVRRGEDGSVAGFRFVK